jgi:uroporphyrinogen-III decarboxylase
LRFSLHIDISPERCAASARRIAARDAGARADRVPVGLCVVARYFARSLGVDYDEFMRDPETHYECSLRFLKFHAEQLTDDFITGPVIPVGPFFDNVINASAFGAEIRRPPGETPRALPVLHRVEDIARMEIPAPDAGLWGRLEAWWRRFAEMAEQTEVTVGGQLGRVVPAPLSIGGEGPHMIAVDLAGTDFYWWQAEHPAACRSLLEKITEGMMAAERRFRRVDPRPRAAYGLAEDSAQAMSADMFRQFCVPFDERMYAAFGAGLPDGRGMHMCGRSEHLHPALVNELRITSFNVFGAPVDPWIAARNLGGRCALWGNVSPLLLLNGTKAEVRAASMRCLEAMAPFGRFTLGDGANVCPGTPVDNLNELTEAARAYGAAHEARSAGDARAPRKGTE